MPGTPTAPPRTEPVLPRQAEQARPATANGVELVGEVDKRSFATAFAPLHASLVNDAGLRNVVASAQTSD